MKEKNINIYKIEKELWRQGYKYICGIDEAGRGPLAGPVCAAAVILNPKDMIEGVKDSKKLSKIKREELFKEIVKRSLAYSAIMIDHKTIDKINILQATFKAMRDAVNKLKIKPDFILIDGNQSPYNQESPTILTIKSGDNLSASIAAASIVAKETRDAYMIDMSLKYPNYAFERHKGYGTKLHYENIDKYGICEIHRKSFLKKYYAK